MSERAETLALQFEQVNGEVIAAVEGCTEEQWRRSTGSEGWPVGVVAHHIALAHAVVLGWVTAAAAGRDLGVSRTSIDEGNARHAQHADTYSQAETLDLLRRNGESAARAVRTLDDAQLDHAARVIADIAPLTTQQVVEAILIRHARSHLTSIQATLGAS